MLDNSSCSSAQKIEMASRSSNTCRTPVGLMSFHGMAAPRAWATGPARSSRAWASTWHAPVASATWNSTHGCEYAAARLWSDAGAQLRHGSAFLPGLRHGSGGRKRSKRFFSSLSNLPPANSLDPGGWQSLDRTTVVLVDTRGRGVGVADPDATTCTWST